MENKEQKSYFKHNSNFSYATPQLKKLFINKKANNMFSDYSSPERNVNSKLIHSSKKIDYSLNNNARSSFHSPVQINKTSIKRNKGNS